jgi:hypothetical protein
LPEPTKRLWSERPEGVRVVDLPGGDGGGWRRVWPVGEEVGEVEKDSEVRDGELRGGDRGREGEGDGYLQRGRTRKSSDRFREREVGYLQVEA